MLFPTHSLNCGRKSDLKQNRKYIMYFFSDLIRQVLEVNNCHILAKRASVGNNLVSVLWPKIECIYIFLKFGSQQVSDYLHAFNWETSIDIYKRDYSKFKESSFLDDIDIQNCNAHEYENTDAELNEFLWRLDACVEPHTPLKKLKQKSN